MTITKGGMDLENIPESPCGMAASQHIGQQAPLSDGKHRFRAGEVVECVNAEPRSEEDREWFRIEVGRYYVVEDVFPDHWEGVGLKLAFVPTPADRQYWDARRFRPLTAAPADGPAEGHDGLAPG